MIRIQNIEELYSYYVVSSQVCTDSRKIEKGDLFFALKGPSFDGNDFALTAIEKGAAYAVVDRERLAQESEKCLYVENVARALMELAKFHRIKMETPVLMITGTNGKTTTKELIAGVLRKKFFVLATEGNLNNEIGLPVTLLHLSIGHQLAVIEAGASHRKDIAVLAEVARPDYGLITNIGKAHLEGFGCEEEILRTKCELYDFIRKKKGVVFVNQSDPLLRAEAKGIKQFSYRIVSSREDRDKIKCEDKEVKGRLLVSSEDLFLSFLLCVGEEEYMVKTQLVGDYNLPNLLAAVAVGVYFDVPLQKIVEALQEYSPGNHRSQLIKETRWGNSLFVDVYNANPSSMRVAVHHFMTKKHSSKVMILGDMLELGACSSQEHFSILSQIKEEEGGNGFIHQLIVVGEQFSKEVSSISFSFPVLSFFSVSECISHFQKNPLRDSFIFLKGSRGIRLESLLSVL